MKIIIIIIISKQQMTEHSFNGQWWHQRSEGARSFRGQKILQTGHPDALFPQKVDDLFLVVALKTGCQRRFIVKIKQIKRSDMVAFLFSVHTITEAKQYAGRRIFQPGHLAWHALV